MDAKEAAEKMKAALSDTDRELAHIKADALLCEIAEQQGYADAVAIFRKAELWYA